MARKHIEFYANSAFGIQLKAQAGVTQGPMFMAEKCQSLLSNVAKSFCDECQALASDTHLTHEGKQEGIRKKAGEQLKHLRREIPRFLGPVTAAYQRLGSSKAAGPFNPPTEALAAIQRMELRQHLGRLDGPQRRQIFDTAIKNDDVTTLAVYFDRSDLYQLLGSEIIKAGKTEYLRRHCPDVLDTEKAGSALVYQIEKLTDDLSLYVTAGNEDAVAIHSELPKLDWEFEETGDSLAIKNNRLPSNLPATMMEPRSKREIEDGLGPAA